jgi:hypothetical protein
VMWESFGPQELKRRAAEGAGTQLAVRP